jgi:hypothetical protein
VTRGQNLSDPGTIGSRVAARHSRDVIFFLIFPRNPARGVIVGAVK